LRHRPLTFYRFMNSMLSAEPAELF